MHLSSKIADVFVLFGKVEYFAFFKVKQGCDRLDMELFGVHLDCIGSY